MRLLALPTVRSPIGLDLGARAIKAAQVARAGAGFRLTAALSMARLDPGPVLSERDAERLGPALVRAGFRGRTLAAALPSEIALQTSVDLPARAARAPLDEIAASELARIGRAEPADLVCAHWQTAAPGTGGASPARVVGAERASLDALLDSLERITTGASCAAPLAIDTGPWALVRCLAPWLGEARDVAVIADIGWRRCALTIVVGQRIIYERFGAGIGGEPLREAIARDLAAPPQVAERLLERIDADDLPPAAAGIASAAVARQADMLTEEVERSLRFAAERGADGDYRVILAGGGATGAMADALRPRLDGLAELRRATPDALISGAAGPAATDPGLICAIGLAMRMDR